MRETEENSVLAQQLAALIEGEKNLIANFSNAAALLYQELENINWAGFYLYEKQSNQLVLGPFQGKVACVRIDLGKGVCGTAFSRNEAIVVPDVLEFPGHIFCDHSSQSEIVIPLEISGKLIGVLDIDAPVKDRFSLSDKKQLVEFVDILVNHDHDLKAVDFYLK